MNIEEIRSIVKLMSDNDLTEFQVSAEEYNLRIRRGNNNVTSVAMPTPVALAPQVAAAPVAAVVAPEAVNAAPKNTVDAPLVGTYYSAPSPEASPFIKVGDTINADTVIGIIEAMKVMNEIKAEKSGVIKRILVDNAQAVEYGQALLEIE